MQSHVVWVPMLRAREEHVGRATGVLSSLRVRHYWDEEGLLLSGFSEALDLDGPAWDLYFLFGPDAVWPDEELPKPAFWMHQLGGSVDAPSLDPDVFAAEAARLIESR